MARGSVEILVEEHTFSVTGGISCGNLMYSMGTVVNTVLDTSDLLKDLKCSHTHTHTHTHTSN